MFEIKDIKLILLSVRWKRCGIPFLEPTRSFTGLYTKQKEIIDYDSHPVHLSSLQVNSFNCYSLQNEREKKKFFLGRLEFFEERERLLLKYLHLPHLCSTRGILFRFMNFFKIIWPKLLISQIRKEKTDGERMSHLHCLFFPSTPAIPIHLRAGVRVFRSQSFVSLGQAI